MQVNVGTDKLKPQRSSCLGIGGPFFGKSKKKATNPRTDIHLYLSVGWRDEKFKTESKIETEPDLSAEYATISN